MKSLRRHRDILLVYASTISLLFLTGLVSPGFLGSTHLRSMAVLAAFIGIAALGQTFVIVGGGIDLSVPWVLNGAAVLITLLAHTQNRPLLWAVPLLLGAGATVGVLNGFGVAFVGVPPIIMTLAVNVILKGAILLLTNGGPTATAPTAIHYIAVGRVGGFPVVLGIWLVLTAGATILLSKTPFGRHLYALGTSLRVAEFSGVPTLRTTVLTYAISGITAALVGILLTGYSGQAYFGMGDPYLFTSIAAVAIGGVSITGGGGQYLGVVAGAFMLTILTGFLPALNLSTGALKIVNGAAILVAVSLASDSWMDLQSWWNRSAQGPFSSTRPPNESQSAAGRSQSR
jgi:ribose transport system permease protein